LRKYSKIRNHGKKQEQVKLFHGSK
jgi:hypothetical protein